MVLEYGHSRAQWIPTIHNISGFAAGIGGQQYLSSLKAQALKYGAEIRRCRVASLSVDDDVFTLRTAEGVLYSRYVLLATGETDHLPDIDGASEAVMRSLLRVCPICDAFEAIDKRIAIIGDGGGCLDFCVSEPYFPQEGRDGYQERDYRRFIEGQRSEDGVFV
ncbi:MAG: hypothetical protein ABI145_19375 [Steroidobacteraceae bacterium]